MTGLVDQILLKSPAPVLTDTEITLLLWGSTPHRQHGLVKRALARGDLVRVRRGLYCLGERFRKRPVHAFELANRIYGPSYVSFQSALSYHGWIPEAVHTTTSASAKRSREFETPFGVFSFIHTPPLLAMTGVEREQRDGAVFLVASPWKALLDYVFAFKKNWTSLDPVEKDLRVDRELLQEFDLDEIKEMSAPYRNKRIDRFIAGLSKDY